jgi:putative transposase
LKNCIHHKKIINLISCILKHPDLKPETYTQMYVHIVIAAKGRENLLTKNIRPRIIEYVSGIITTLKHKSLIVNGYIDHIHVLFGMNPSVSISDTVHDIKRGSSLFINSNKLVNGRFYWQEGYGGFTYSRNQLDYIFNYIKTQEEHHSLAGFRKEYETLLINYEIEYDNKYLFDFYD